LAEGNCVKLRVCCSAFGFFLSNLKSRFGAHSLVISLAGRLAIDGNASGSTHRLVHHYDIFPTPAEIAGA
jgi:hypothetical protein